MGLWCVFVIFRCVKCESIAVGLIITVTPFFFKKSFGNINSFFHNKVMCYSQSERRLPFYVDITNIQTNIHRFIVVNAVFPLETGTCNFSNSYGKMLFNLYFKIEVEDVDLVKDLFDGNFASKNLEICTSFLFMLGLKMIAMNRLLIIS